MKNTLTTLAAVVALSSVSSISFAQETNKSQLNPWAHCGIGAVIFKDNGTAATISNIIWDLGTTAVTSASASADSCQGDTANVARFMTESYNNLEEEIVKGEGSHLNAMLNMVGCSSENHASATQAIRNDFSAVMTAENYEELNTVEKAQQVHNIATSACAAS